MVAGGHEADGHRDSVERIYAQERAKRLRGDGIEQYRSVDGSLTGYAGDPYTEFVERDPLRDQVEVAIIGGGFAGLVTAARLREVGVTDVRIIDKAGGFGGVWYWNRYPGVQCDTHSFVYMPLLEETGHVPTEKYAHGPEILEHCERIAERYRLHDGACLQTAVTEIEWESTTHRWVIRTDRDDEMRARFLVMGTGPLQRPKLPGLAGIEDFAGRSFHTSRWDYAYTGGDPSGAALTGLVDRRVGVIGTGATAVQCVPRLAESAGELFVFQRTPSSVDARDNHAIDMDWFDSAVRRPGWQDEWLTNFCTLQTGGLVDEDLVMDGWTEIARRLRDRVLADPDQDFGPDSLARAFAEADLDKMDEIRARVDAIVEDSATAAALKPWYRQLCKRPCFHDEYLQSFNRHNVHLVDTDGRGVERVTRAGVVVDGVEYRLDCLVFASGFEVGTDHRHRNGYDVVGVDGLALSQHWADGMRTFQGMYVRGFPNMFIVGAAQGANLVSNYPHNLAEGARTVAAVIDQARRADADEVEVGADVEEAWVEQLRTSGARMLGGLDDCTPGYYNNEGRAVDERHRVNSAGYPGGPLAFFEYLRAWRTTGDFDGLEFSGTGSGGQETGPGSVVNT